VKKQRLYNIETVDEMLRADTKTVRVTADFGASYFIGGQRFVTLILFLKYFDETGDFSTECLYNIVTDPDERSEDAFYVRGVWVHHLKISGVFDLWRTIILQRDSGAHFQNNNITYFESTIGPEFGKKFIVSAFAKRHGFNECDGALARFNGAVRAKSLEGSPPTTASSAAFTINSHEKFGNCTAYYFDKIDRNPALFPKLRPFVGIQAHALCEFKYEFTDIDGTLVREAGYAMGRPISGEGPWQFHDFLPHTRTKAWGKLCLPCSCRRARAVYHKRPGEPLAACARIVDRPIIQPDVADIDPALQPPPRTQRKQDALLTGVDAVRCGICITKLCKNQRGLEMHSRAAHPGETILAVSVGAGGAIRAVSVGAGEAIRAVSVGAGDSEQKEEPLSSSAAGRGRGRRGRGRVGNGRGSSGSKRGRGATSSSRKRLSKLVNSSSESDQGSDNGIDSDGDPLYEVDEVVDEQGVGDEMEYLVYWRPRTQWLDPTWLHHSNLGACDRALAAFKASRA